MLSNTASAILQVRNQLSREMTERAIDALQQARRVSIFASGHYCVVAKDAEYKFLRLGITCGAYVEPRLQQLAAELLGPGDVAILTSGGGRAPELLNVLDLAQARGARSSPSRPVSHRWPSGPMPPWWWTTWRTPPPTCPWSAACCTC